MTAIAAASSLYAPRAAALALAHAATGPALVLSAGILPADFAAATRLVIVLLPTSAGGLLVGWANAALLRAMPRAATPWMAFFLAAASPFAIGVAAFVLLLVGGVFAAGGLPDDGLVWTLFALPFAMVTTPWPFVGSVAALGGLALALMRPLARATESR
ncbi:MAG: hypothetical protein ACK5AL_01615 [Planctomycetota bacterium]|jgi:hypothetical protein